MAIAIPIIAIAAIAIAALATAARATAAIAIAAAAATKTPAPGGGPCLGPAAPSAKSQGDLTLPSPPSPSLASPSSPVSWGRPKKQLRPQPSFFLLSFFDLSCDRLPPFSCPP